MRALAKHLMFENIPEAFLVNLVVGSTAWFLKTVRKSGMIYGVLAGTLIYICMTMSGWLILLIFFCCASFATKLGRSQKKLHGTQQPKEGRRGKAEVLSKVGVPLIIACLMPLLISGQGSALFFAKLAYCGALAAALADTLGSEIGPLTSGKVWQLPSLRKASHGSPGGVSVLGLAASALGAWVIAQAGYEFFGMPMLPIFLAGFVASLIDGVLSALSKNKSEHFHHWINFCACSISAILANAIYFLS